MKICNSEITLHNEDCFDVFKNIQDNSINCIVTDPPYNIGFQGKKAPGHKWDKFTEEEYYKLLSYFLSEAYRVLKPNSSCWFFFAPTRIRTILQIVENSNFQLNLENWSIYARAKGRGAKNKLKSLREDIFHLSKGSYKFNYVEYLRRVVAPYILNGKPRGWFLDISTGEPMRWSGLGNVLSFTAPTHNSKFEKSIHSTQKPTLLMAALQMVCTQPGDTVLDPFMGSGSTGIASILCNRNFIGCEKSKEMFEASLNWFNNFNHKEAENYVKRLRSL